MTRIACWLLAIVASATAAQAAETPATGETLADFFSAAIDYSPRLRIAEEKRNVFSARKRIALGGLLPQVDAAASITENRRSSADPFLGTDRLQVFDASELFMARLRGIVEPERKRAVIGRAFVDVQDELLRRDA